MKKLSTQFVLNHIDEQFMIGINAIYWMSTIQSSMSNVLEENEYPTYSELFYRMYGKFSPMSPELALRDIAQEKTSTTTLDQIISWEEFVMDVIGFFRHSNASQEIRKLIKEKFFDHYDYIADVNDHNREMTAKKIFNEFNDNKMLVFFEFKELLLSWDSREVTEVTDDEVVQEMELDN